MRGEKQAGDGKLVLKNLVEYIRENNLSSGDRLPAISELAGMWGTGWNSVREGLIRAENIGLLDIRPRSGCFVKTPDFSPLSEALAETIDLILTAGDRNLLHLIEARFILEIETVVLAAGKRRIEDMLVLKESLDRMARSRGDDYAYITADERFHLGIAELTGNSVLKSILNALLVLLRPYRLTMAMSEEKRAESDEVHRQIYSSIVESNAGEAGRLMKKHLEVHRESLMRTLQSAGESTANSGPGAGRDREDRGAR